MDEKLLISRGKPYQLGQRIGDSIVIGIQWFGCKQHVILRQAG